MIIRNINNKDDINSIYNLVENLFKYHSELSENYKKFHLATFNNQAKLDIINDIKNRYSYIAIKDEKPIGLLIAYKKKSFIYISDLYIDLEYRNQNIGNKLLNTLIENYPNEDIRLLVLKENRKVTPFYKKYGFRHIGNISNNYYKITCLELERKALKITKR